MKYLTTAEVANMLGTNVRHFRWLKGISQEILAERSGIFRTYLSRIENGNANPTTTVLVALAAALEVPAHVLLVPLEE